jgi:hypothetical protein
VNKELQHLFMAISDHYAGSVGAGCVEREESHHQDSLVLTFFDHDNVKTATVELQIFPARVGSGALGGVEDEELVKIRDEDGNDVFVSNVPSVVIAVATR